MLELKHYKCAELLMDYIDNDSINYIKDGINALFLIISDTKLDITLKNNYVSKLIEKGFNINLRCSDQDILSICIQLDDSHILIETILMYLI